MYCVSALGGLIKTNKIKTLDIKTLEFSLWKIITLKNVYIILRIFKYE